MFSRPRLEIKRFVLVRLQPALTETVPVEFSRRGGWIYILHERPGQSSWAGVFAARFIDRRRYGRGQALIYNADKVANHSKPLSEAQGI